MLTNRTASHSRALQSTAIFRCPTSHTCRKMAWGGAKRDGMEGLLVDDNFTFKAERADPSVLEAIKKEQLELYKNAEQAASGKKKKRAKNNAWVFFREWLRQLDAQMSAVYDPSKREKAHHRVLILDNAPQHEFERDPKCKEFQECVGRDA